MGLEVPAMKRRKPLKTHKRLKARNDKRADAKFKRNFHSREFVEFTNSQPCVFCGETPSECAHAEPRGMGGCGADWTRTFPACTWHHSQYDLHRIPVTKVQVDRYIALHQKRWKRHQAVGI